MDLHMKMSVEPVIPMLQMIVSKIVQEYGVVIQSMIYVEFVAEIIQAVLIVQELQMDLLMWMNVVYVMPMSQMIANKIVQVYGVAIQNMIYVEFVAEIIQAVLIVKVHQMD